MDGFCFTRSRRGESVRELSRFSTSKRAERSRMSYRGAMCAVFHSLRTGRAFTTSTRLWIRRAPYRAAYRHVLGREFAEDQEVFCAGEGEGLRLFLVSDTTRLGFLVYRFRDKTRIDFYLKTLEPDGSLERVFADAEHTFGPRLLPGRILAITDRDAPNFRIVELRIHPNRDPGMD